MELFNFNSKVLMMLPPSERKQYLKILEKVVMPVGRPFFLESNGLPSKELEGFCNYLLSPRRPSVKTWKTYSSQVAVFIRFMEAQGRHWLQATKKDLDLYFTVRTTGEFQSSPPLKGRSWNVAKAAIVHLYEYALEEGLIEKAPFSYRKIKPMFGGAVIEVADLSAKFTPEPINFISITNYKKLWRPVLADGENAQRNQVLVDTLIVSGLRITEALNLEIHQIPDPDDQRFAGRKGVTIRVMGKGRKARNVIIPKRIIRAIRFYIDEERVEVVEKMIARKGKRSVKVPTKLFLSRNGKPQSSRTVESLFCRISKLTNLKLTPHGCRHTYAVYQLESMIKRMAKNLKTVRDGGADAYRQILNDPMRDLQRLLGHSQISSTYIYLDFLEESESLVDESLEDWSNWEHENVR